MEYYIRIIDATSIKILIFVAFFMFCCLWKYGFQCSNLIRDMV